MTAITGATGWTGFRARHQRVEAEARCVAAAAVAGAVLGWVILGWGSRLAMMLLANLNPSVAGRVSDDGFVMGRFQLGPTLGLTVFCAAVGMLAGLVYLAIRPLKFGPAGFQRGALFLGPAVVGGSFLVHTDGIDFRVLEPTWLAIALFVALPGVFGLALSLLADRWIDAPGGFAVAPFPVIGVALLPVFAFLPIGLPVLAAWLLRSAYVNARVDHVRARRVIVAAGRVGLTAVALIAAVDVTRKTLHLL